MRSAPKKLLSNTARAMSSSIVLDRRDDHPPGVVHQHVEAVAWWRRPQRAPGRPTPRRSRRVAGSVIGSPTVVAGHARDSPAPAEWCTVANTCAPPSARRIGSRQPDPAVATGHEDLGHGEYRPMSSLTARPAPLVWATERALNRDGREGAPMTASRLRRHCARHTASPHARHRGADRPGRNGRRRACRSRRGRLRSRRPRRPRRGAADAGTTSHRDAPDPGAHGPALRGQPDLPARVHRREESRWPIRPSRSWPRPHPSSARSSRRSSTSSSRASSTGRSRRASKKERAHSGPGWGCRRASSTRSTRSAGTSSGRSDRSSRLSASSTPASTESSHPVATPAATPATSDRSRCGQPVVDAVDVPVLASGGVSDGRTLAAALVLGCQGAWCGTRFLATAEMAVDPRAKQRVVDAGTDDTVVTRVFSGKPLRVIRNEYVDSWRDRESEILPFPLQVFAAEGRGRSGLTARRRRGWCGPGRSGPGPDPRRGVGRRRRALDGGGRAGVPRAGAPAPHRRPARATADPSSRTRSAPIRRRAGAAAPRAG